jgi:type IV fimbrial biogenesis protein FimT
MRNFTSRGFSLLELMIVIAIILILTLLAAPSFGDWMQNSRTRSVAESLQNGLRYAQGEAARLSRLTTLTLSSNTGWIVTYAKNATGDTLANPLQTQDDSGLDNVKTTAVPATGSAIQFTSFGRATSDVTYQVRGQGSRKLNVVVSQAGKVRMCDPDKTFSNTTPDGC